ncbi:hypothetical protein V6O07_22945 [Arthrospira platensis SPKY2]
MVEIFILVGFNHIFGGKNVFLRSGQTYYLSLDRDREEIAWMLSSSFPYRNRINVRLTPAVVSALGTDGNSSLTVFNNPPPNPVPGTMYFNAVSARPYVWDGSEWIDLVVPGSDTGSSSIIPALFGDVTSTGFDNNVQIAPQVIVNNDISPTAAIQISKLETNPLNRINHFGTQLSTSISDFVQKVREQRLTDLSLPSTNLNLNNYRLVNIAPATMDQDAVNYAQVFGMIQGITSLNSFIGPLKLDQGGTGITANTPIEALNNLQGISDGKNLGTAVDGARVFFAKEINGGAIPSTLNFRRVKGGIGIEVVEGGNFIEINLGPSSFLDINTALGGYPLLLENGGTGAMTPLAARLNLEAVGNAQNSVVASDTVSNLFIEKVGDVLRFRSLQQGLGISLNHTLSTDRIIVSVIENDLCLHNLSGSISLTSSQINGQLPISRGGTDGTNPFQARRNLGAVGDAISLGGSSIVASPSKDFTSADPTILRFKGISVDPTNNILSIDDSDPSSLSILFDPSELDISLTTGTLNASNRLSGVVPINRGGTNATTVGESRVNLGVIYKAQRIVGSIGESILPTTSVILDDGLGYSLNTKGIRAGLGINVKTSLSGHDIIISSTVPNNYEIVNIGTGVGAFYQGSIGNTFNFKTLRVGAAGGINLQNQPNEILINAQIANASNLGTGVHILTPFTTPGAELKFRSIKSRTNSLTADGIKVTSNANEILLVSHIANITSLGSGIKLFQDLEPDVANNVKFKSLLPQGLQPGLTITQTDEEVRFQTILANAVNLGIGSNILRNPTPITDPGTILEFKSILAGPGINIQGLANEVVINNKIISVGGFTSLLSPTVINPGDAIELRSLRAGVGINISTVNPNIIDISSTLIEYNMANVGTGLGMIYRDITGGNTFNFKTLDSAPGDRILINNDSSVITFDINESNIDINNLGGTPLTVINGGTGSTTPAGIRDIIDVVFDVRNSAASASAGISLIDAVNNAVGEGKIVELRRLIAGDDIIINTVGSDLVINSTAHLIPLPGQNIGTQPGTLFVEGSETTGFYRYKTIGTQALNPGAVITNNADSILIRPFIASINVVASAGESIINTPLALPVTTPNTVVEFKRVIAQDNTPITVQTVGPNIQVGISQLGAFIDGVVGTETSVGSGIYQYTVNHNLNITGTQMIVQAITNVGQVAQLISINSAGGNTVTITTSHAGPLNFRVIKVGP